jgi:hypothetical protein
MYSIVCTLINHCYCTLINPVVGASHVCGRRRETRE